MTIVSVSVESNGWILAVRGTWGATTGAWRLPGDVAAFGDNDFTNSFWGNGGVDQFPLDPSGTPKVTLSVQDAGYNRVGGLPVANANRAREVVATKPLRKAWPDQADLDEFDHGDGTRTVRLALSDRIYDDTTIISASFLSGWKAGQGGGVVNTVTNNSTITVPLPIFRWANEPWPLVQGTEGSPNHLARVEVLIATHHPEHDGSNLHQPCAALRLRAFDGTTTKDFFFSGPQTSTLYGDSLRCWGGEIDLSGLNAGPITVHATVYPWVGAERSTGTAHSTSITAALSPTWGAPFHLYYDPTGTVWPRKYVAIDTASTNTDAANAGHVAAVVLHDTPAAAEAAAVGTKPANYSVALRRMGDAAVTMAARNGFASQVRCAAWWEVLLPAGTHSHITAVGASTGPSAGPGQFIISHVPSASSPRTNVIFAIGGTARLTNGAVDRVKVRGIRVNLGTSEIFAARTGSWTSYEDCDVRSASGATGSGANMYQSEANTSAMKCDMRDRAAQPRGWFARNVVRTAAHNISTAACIIGVRIDTPGGGEAVPSRTNTAFSVTANPNDFMLWNCQVYGWGGPLFQSDGNTFFGEDRASRRFAIVNTTVEGAAGGGPIQQLGETQASQLRDSIFENVTMASGRFNWHNDNNLTATAGPAAVRVNNAPTTTIVIGVMAHGLTTGDTITTSGFSNANMNRTDVAVTVLDANRFSYTAAAAVTAVPATVGSVEVTSGARDGDILTIRRDNLKHTGNVIRYSSFDRNATKHDTFNDDPGLTGSWELLYGVGFRGNVNANRGTDTPGAFQYAFYGIGSEAETNFGAGGLTDVASYDVNWHGYVDDNSNAGPDAPTGTLNGDYRAQTADLDAFTPSRLLGKGTAPAVTDRDAQNAVRGSTFPAGALGATPQLQVPVSLRPVVATIPHIALSGGISWAGFLRTVGSVSPHRADAAGLRLTAAPTQPGVRSRLLRVASESRRLDVEPD